MSNNMPYGTLRDIANELKNIREVLEKQQSIEVSEDNEPTWEQVKEYCFKRNFAIVGRETPKEYLRGFAEASEDAISREWVSVNMLKHGFHAPDMTVGEFLADAPSVIPQPKEGEWISNHNGYWTCSECGLSFLFYAKGNYCPNCGSKMKGADDVER